MNVNESIIYYRNKRNLSQNEVASQAGINLKHYQAIERGDQQPRLRTLAKIVDVIHIPFDLLYKDTCKEFLIFSIASCLEQYNETELNDFYGILGDYINEE